MKLCNCRDKHVRHGMPVCLDGNDLFYQICPKCKGKVEQIKFDKKTGVTEEWIEEKAKRAYEIVEVVGSSSRQWIEHDKAKYIHEFKDFIRSLVE